MKTLVLIFSILYTTTIASSEMFNEYRFKYYGKSYKMSEFISKLRAAMPNDKVRANFDKHIDAILYYSIKRNLDPVLVLSMIIVESGLKNHNSSKVGAQGLMQIMPKTKEDIKTRILAKPEFSHLTINKQMDFDLDVPSHNIDLGTIYVVYLMEKFKGNIEKVVIAYNMGPGYIESLPKNFKHNHRHYNRVKNVYGKINKRLMGNEENSREPASSKLAKM